MPFCEEAGAVVETGGAPQARALARLSFGRGLLESFLLFFPGPPELLGAPRSKTDCHHPWRHERKGSPPSEVLGS